MTEETDQNTGNADHTAGFSGVGIPNVNPEKSAPSAGAEGAPSVSTPPPATPPILAPVTPPAPSPTPGHDLGADVAKILEGVKLPERYEFKGSGEHASIPNLPIESILAPATPPTPIPQTATPTPPKEVSSVVSLHTLKDDIQHVVHDEKISLVRAASLEQDRKIRAQETAGETPGSSQRSKRVFGILFTVMLLFVLGAAALFGVLFVMSGPGQQQAPQLDSLLFAEQTLALPLSGASPADIKQQIAQTRSATPGTLGSITRIVPMLATSSADGTQTTRPATAMEFLQALGANVPEELARSLGTNFFFGIHAIDKNAPVFVISVISYDHAFAGMLAWENSINSDLSPIFTAVSAYYTDQSGIPQARTFSDEIMRNYDTRVLKSDSGTSVMYYAFPTPTLLIIAESPYTFAEVLSRLRAERRL